MSTFKVGEVVVGAYFVDKPEYNGVEGMIIALEYWHGTRKHPPGPCAIVAWSSGETRLVYIRCLRKKRPPTTGEESIIAMFRKDKRPEGVEA